MAKQGLKFTEKNTLIKALRTGLPWEQAKKLLPGVDPKALDGFRDDIMAEMKRTAPAEKIAKVDPEEYRRALDEINNLRRALDEKGPDSSEIEALKAENAKLGAEVKRLQAEIESLILDDGKGKKK